jgi:RNA polymerase sigma-70 factor (ECF subfamily)
MTDEKIKAAHFVELVEQGRSRLLGYIYALVLNFADAEDLYQQVVAVLWQKFDQYRPGTEFDIWAMCVAKFTVKNFVRRKRLSKVLFNENVVEQLIEDQTQIMNVSASSRANALAHCLGFLSNGDRRLIELCYNEDNKIRDVAAVEGRTTESMYATLRRIRRALYHCIEKYLVTEGRA